jgi:hypothetical protein
MPHSHSPVPLKPLALLMGCLVACSARIGIDRQKDRQTDKHTDILDIYSV